MKTKWNNKSGTRTYYAWRSMRNRCSNPKNHAWHYYGGRGISVCAEWENDYDQFFADMGECPDGMSLDRIDNEKGYSKQNCRWASNKEQANNRRITVFLEINGNQVTLSDAAAMTGLKKNTLWSRIKVRKMPLDKALKQEDLNRKWSHGTRQGYEKHGCRCDLCRESNNKRHRDRRMAKAAMKNACGYAALAGEV